MTQTISTVGLPLPNINMAMEYIATNKFLKVGKYTISKKKIFNEVDQFMRDYPRGKGTKKSSELREMYANCYAIKLNNSRTKKFTKMRSVVETALHRLTDEQKNIILSFERNDSTDVSSISKRTINKLIKEEIVDGYYPSVLWLTELGLEMQKRLIDANHPPISSYEIDIVIGNIVSRTNMYKADSSAEIATIGINTMRTDGSIDKNVIEIHGKEQIAHWSKYLDARSIPIEN